MNDKLEITVYADATGLFTEEEYESENLTQITVGRLIVERWLKEEMGQRFKSLEEFLGSYTADDTEHLLWWLIRTGYDIVIEGRLSYKYGMRLRGFSPGCQPDDGFAYHQEDRTGKYWDIIVYNRPLTEKETKHYALDQLEVQVPA